MYIHFVNLTPHAIVVRGKDGVDSIIHPSGKVARVMTTEVVIDPSNAPFPVVKTRITGITGIDGIPDGHAGLVSSLVLDNLPREVEGAFFAPDTGPTAIRNAEGQIVAVTRLRLR